MNKENNEKELEQNDDKNKSSVDQAEYERVKAESEKIAKELEDLRGEVMSEEYIEFLSSKSKGKDKSNDDNKSKEKEKSKYDGLTPDQIADKVKADLKAELEAEQSDKEKEEARREIAAFKRSHADYDKYRPIMHSLSLDPENSDLTLQELYDAAKEFTKKEYGELSPEERKRLSKTGGEKPGNSSSSQKKSEQKLSPEAAADEAWDEVVGDSGLPSF